MTGGYYPYAKYAIIEYRIAWGVDGDCHDLEIYEGKHWRKARKIVKLCEQGLDEPEIDKDGSELTIQWIERVERWMDQHGHYTGDDDYEDLWSRSQSEKEESE